MKWCLSRLSLSATTRCAEVSVWSVSAPPPMAFMRMLNLLPCAGCDIAGTLQDGQVLL